MVHSTQIHGQAAQDAAGYLAGWQRARADLVNFQKQLPSQQAMERTAQLKHILEPILTLADNFRSMGAHVPADFQKNPWTEGVLHIARQLDTILSQYQVVEIKAEGEVFNPHLHEAIEKVSHADAPSGTIISVVRRGYLLGDEVLRPARVKVAS